jgi:predicted Fe-S protein YdhL (DUF1289 family)
VTDEVWRREAIESPCVKVCLLHPVAGLCIGCFRTADEIAAWSTMTPDERRTVMAELPARAPRVSGTRRGGRAGRRARDEA